jgi:putative ABC transport system permease protein
VGALALVLRLARRQARRRLGRTVAIVITLALPVVAGVAVDVMVHSDEMTPAERAARQLGGAQASLSWVGQPIWQAPDPSLGGWEPRARMQVTVPPEPPGPPSALLPPGSVAQPSFMGTAQFSSGGRSGGAISVLGEQLSSPAFSDLVELKSGHVPTGPGQVALTPRAASDLGVGTGGWATGPKPVDRLSVVGIVAVRYEASDEEAFVTPQQARPLMEATGGFWVDWWVSGKRPVNWADVQRLDRAGWFVTSHQVIEHPPPSPEVAYDQSGSSLSAKAATAGALLLCMALLEIVLMAGPAFAVGARQRERELANLAAAGAGPWHLAGVVLGDGAVLGLGAGFAGAACGAGAGAVSLAVQRAWTGIVPGSVELRWADIAGVAAVAVVAGLLGALLPALQARRHGAVGARRRQWVARRPNRAVAMAGLVCLGIAALLASLVWSGDLGDVWVVWVAALGEVALLLLTPAVLQVTSSVGRALPLWGRMAARDVERRRSAAAPAVAAIMAVVAASAALMVMGASMAAQDRAAYQPMLPVGDAFMETLTSGVSSPAARQIAQRLHRVLPAATSFVVWGAQPDNACSVAKACRSLVFELWLPAGCPGRRAPLFVTAQGGSVPVGAGAAEMCGTGTRAYMSDVLVLSPARLRALLGGSPGRSAAAALSRGEVVALSPGLVHRGKVCLRWSTRPGGGHSDGPLIAYPATYVASPAPVALVAMSPSQAARVGQVTDVGVVVLGATRAPARQLRAASRLATGLGDLLYIERGFQSSVGTLLLFFAGGDLLLVAVAAVVATALIGADSRDELAVLAVLGAPPDGRRRLSMARAGTIAGLGSAAGTVAGAFFGAVAARTALPGSLAAFGFDPLLNPSMNGPVVGVGPVVSVPWQLVLLFLAAPVAAGTCAAVLGRGRLPIERRRVT